MYCRVTPGVLNLDGILVVSERDEVRRGKLHPCRLPNRMVTLLFVKSPTHALEHYVLWSQTFEEIHKVSFVKTDLFFWKVV